MVSSFGPNNQTSNLFKYVMISLICILQRWSLKYAKHSSFRPLYFIEFSIFVVSQFFWLLFYVFDMYLESLVWSYRYLSTFLLLFFFQVINTSARIYRKIPSCILIHNEFKTFFKVHLSSNAHDRIVSLLVLCIASAVARSENPGGL